LAPTWAGNYCGLWQGLNRLLKNSIFDRVLRETSLSGETRRSFQGVYGTIKIVPFQNGAVNGAFIEFFRSL